MRHARPLCFLLLPYSLLLLVAPMMACGGQASSRRPRTEQPVQLPEVDQAAVPSEPVGSAGATTSEPLPVPIVPEPELPAVEPPPLIPDNDVRARGVAAILVNRCAGCYSGPGAQSGVALLSELVAQGEILAGNSSRSPLWLRASGALPSPNGREERLTPGEVALLADLIDQLPSRPTPSCTALAFLGHDAVLATLLADLASVGTPATTRYVSLTYASNAGLCGVELERHRSALFKVVNSVSTADRIAVPVAVDANGLLYRIELTDYGWQRPLDLEGDGDADFGDAWLAIVSAVREHATEYAGPEADALKVATQTAVPLLPAHALLHAASVDDLYYSLIGTQQDAHATRAELGVDLSQDVGGNLVRRAGFQRPAGFPRDTLVLRFEQKARSARSYWVLQEDGEVRGDSIFGDPLGLLGQGGLSIFQLPNGLLAYGLEDESGARFAQDISRCALLGCEDSTLHTLAGCPACHERGLLPVTDAIRGFVEQNVPSYDSETLRDVRVQYPGADGFSQLLEADSVLTRSAAQAAGALRTGPEPLSYVHSAFQRDSIGLSEAAAELSVLPATLAEQLGNLHPYLQPLVKPEGRIDRARLLAAYPSALCTLHASARNRPVPCP